MITLITNNLLQGHNKDEYGMFQTRENSAYKYIIIFK